LDAVPASLRSAYEDFRSAVLELSPEIESRPAPVRNGVRRYEGFFFRRRNVIYAHFGARGVRLQFELPPDHDVPRTQVVRSGERDFRRYDLREVGDLDTATRLARETIARVGAR
jgi:hypothetical protein